MEKIELNRQGFLMKALRFANCEAYFNLIYYNNSDSCEVVKGLVLAAFKAFMLSIATVLLMFAIACVGAEAFYDSGFELTTRAIIVGFGVGAAMVVLIGAVVAGVAIGFTLSVEKARDVIHDRANKKGEPTAVSKLYHSFKNKYCTKVSIK